MNPVRTTIICLVLAYLLILGYAHFTRTDEPVRLDREDTHHHSSRRTQAPPKPPKKSAKPTPSATEFTLPPKGRLPELAPSSLSPQQKFEYYKDLAKAYEQSVTRVTVLGFRGINPDGLRHSSDDNASKYDDAFVILNPGKQTAEVFLGSTHAGQFTSSLSPDGVAQIDIGRYKAYPNGDFAEMPSWLVKAESGTDEIPCKRDVNGNGIIDPEEKIQGWVATEILFHNGRYLDYGSSIGCQVIPPTLMEHFIETVGIDSEFDYLLIDANLSQ